MIPVARPKITMSSAREEDEFERRADPRGDQARDALMVDERGPEVAVERVEQPAQVPGEERLVEVVVAFEQAQRGGRQRPAAGDRRDRAARGEVDRAVDREAGDQQAGDEHRRDAWRGTQPSSPRLRAVPATAPACRRMSSAAPLSRRLSTSSVSGSAAGIHGRSRMISRSAATSSSARRRGLASARAPRRSSVGDAAGCS